MVFFLMLGSYINDLPSVKLWKTFFYSRPQSETFFDLILKRK